MSESIETYIDNIKKMLSSNNLPFDANKIVNIGLQKLYSSDKTENDNGIFILTDIFPKLTESMEYIYKIKRSYPFGLIHIGDKLFTLYGLGVFYDNSLNIELASEYFTRYVNLIVLYYFRINKNLFLDHLEYILRFFTKHNNETLINKILNFLLSESLFNDNYYLLGKWLYEKNFPNYCKKYFQLFIENTSFISTDKLLCFETFNNKFPDHKIDILIKK